PPPTPLPAPPKRILIIKPSALGDIVHPLPLLPLLRNRFPGATITWLVVPAFASLLTDHPQIDDVILFERRRWTSVFALSRALRERAFDLVLDVQGLFRSGFLGWMTGAPVRVGFSYAREMAWWFYTADVDTPTPERHAIERYLDVAEALGCARGPVTFEFGVTEADRTAVDALFDRSTPYAVLLPGTNWATKRWPAGRFGGLVRPLQSDLSLVPVIAGGNDAAALAPQIPGAIDLTCRTTHRQLVALLERASLVITNDSGPMHIAAALGVPMVSLFGPTSPIRTGPYRRELTVLRTDICCSPCYSRTCTHHSCLRELTSDRVLSHARTILDPDASARHR
ncbi:MAG TPA: lipopolysaccharide heptosyltransferase II, partial [Tepidisphaeraceae bacterium]|nr:lipopolysaccharide heptosyltransferase II [Tepidisphaeraceae bacterium]